MSKVTVIARWTVNPEQIHNVSKHFEKMITFTKQEEGNLCYELYRKDSASNEWLIYEEYSSMDDFEIHKNADYFQEIVLKEILPHLLTRSVSIF